MPEALLVVVVITSLVGLPLASYAAYRLMPRKRGKAVFYIGVHKFHTMLSGPDSMRITDKRKR